MTFDDAVAFVLAEEGGYVNNPADPGGETKFGISKRSYPDLDIINLTRDEASAIYRRDYWQACRCDELPPLIALALFDSAVNVGPARAIKWLQAAVHANQDGVVGDETLGKAQALDPVLTAQELLAQRLAFYGKLPNFGAFGLGWCRRTLRLFHVILRG